MSGIINALSYGRCGGDISVNTRLMCSRRFRDHWTNGAKKQTCKDSIGDGRAAIVSPKIYIFVEVGIADKSDMVQFLQCDMKRTGNNFLVNNRELTIEASIFPAHQGMVTAMEKDWNENLLPSNKAAFEFLLRSNEKTTCSLIVNLRSTEGVLDQIHYKIRVDGEDLCDFQAGYEIEQPLPKQRPQGFYASDSAQRILARFRTMADNGYGEEFRRKRFEMEDLAAKKLNVGRRYQYLLPFVLYEKAIMYLHENNQTGAAASIDKALEFNRTYNENANYPYLLAKRQIIVSAIERRRKNFSLSEEELQEAIKILETCVSGFEKAEASYAMATFLSEKSAAVGINKDEKKLTKDYFRDVHRHLEQEEAQKNPGSVGLRARTGNRKLNFLLKTSRHARKPGNRGTVKQGKMMEAWREIQRVKKQTGLIESYTKKQRMSFCIVEADYFIMQEDYSNAFKPLNEARIIAYENNWANFVDRTTSRLQHCQIIRGSTERR